MFYCCEPLLQELRDDCCDFVWRCWTCTTSGGRGKPSAFVQGRSIASLGRSGCFHEGSRVRTRLQSYGFCAKVCGCVERGGMLLWLWGGKLDLVL